LVLRQLKRGFQDFLRLQHAESVARSTLSGGST
jgi:hypothetical protein